MIDAFTTISNDLDVGIWKANSDGIVTYSNKKIQDFFHTDLLGKNITEYFSNIEDGSEFTFKYTNGSVKWYKVTVYRPDDEEIYGIVRDITTEKIIIPQLREIQQEMREIFRTVAK